MLDLNLKIIRQSIWQEKPAYVVPIYRSLPKLIESPTQIYLGEREAIDSDSLEHDINVHFKENYPQQEGVISEVHQSQINHTSQIAK